MELCGSLRLPTHHPLAPTLHCCRADQWSGAGLATHIRGGAVHSPAEVLMVKGGGGGSKAKEKVVTQVLLRDGLTHKITYA
jgi:hypothetical protein